MRFEALRRRVKVRLCRCLVLGVSAAGMGVLVDAGSASAATPEPATAPAEAAPASVHEVFLALPEALGRFRGQCPLRSYILSITVRRARQHLRAAKRRRAIEARAMVVADVAPAPAPDAELQRLLQAAAHAD